MPDIHVSRVDPHPANVREDLGDLTELAASVRVHGVLQPLIVQRDGTRYLVLAGHRRLAAARLARLDTVPCVIRPAAARGQRARAVEVMLAENCHRADLTAMEKAEAMGALRGLGYTAARIAARTGLRPSTVSRYLALLDLDDDTRRRVAAGTVQVGDAIAAVRASRKAARRGAAGPGRPVRREPAWLAARHPLAAAAAQACSHSRRPLVGKVACGQCWEAAIRGDQDARADAARADAAAAASRGERAAALAEMAGAQS